MWWRKSRDILVETFTIVQRVEQNFVTHEKKQDKQISGLHDLIRACHESCPEKENFDTYVRAQNGTLLRMEKKYDNFFKEFTKVRTTVHDMNTVKKTKGDILTTWVKYTTITALVLGMLYGYLQICDTAKKKESQKIMENK